MAKQIHSFVRIEYEESDGNHDVEICEIAQQDVKLKAVSFYKEEVETP